MPRSPQDLAWPAGRRQARWWVLLRRAATGIVTVLLLGGCVVKVVYNQLDWLALWYVEDYFNLDADQEAQAKLMINRTLTWHRQTQVPRYASLARAMLGDLDRPAGAGVVAGRFAEAEALWDELLRQAVPDFARLLQSLRDEQVEELLTNLADENRELAGEYSGASRDERRAKQDKAIIRAFRRFTGRLTPGQEALVRQYTARFHDLSTEWLVRRGSWQNEFSRLLAGRQADPLFADRMADLLLNPNQFDSPEYRQRVLENQQLSFQLVAAVIDSLSRQQTRTLRDNLTTYADDFDALVRGKPGRAQENTTGQTSNREKDHDEAA